MIHAHLIMVHSQPDQLGRLIRAIDHPDNLFLVHVDRKSPRRVHERIAAFASARSNVHLMQPRDVRWASWSVVATTLAGIAELMRLNAHWSHFSNLSGQDFPLRSQAEIITHLQRRPDANYVEYFDPTRWISGPDRIRHIRIEPPWPRRGITLRGVMMNRWEPILGQTRYWGGSSYFTLTRDFCEHLLASPRLAAFQRFFRFSYSADEIFLPTFILDSPWRESVINDNLRLIDFSEGLPRPRIWTMADRQRLLDSDKFYARKFDPDVDQQIIGLLEQRSAEATRRST